MMSLNTMETGYSILTLEEALQTFYDGEESKLFCLKLKPNDKERTSNIKNKNGCLIRLRKIKVKIGEGKESQIVIIRDFSDSVNLEKV